jgi:hypothetical protein
MFGSRLNSKVATSHFQNSILSGMERSRYRTWAQLATHHPVIEPVSAIRVRNGIFRCRDRGSNPPFCLAETDAETRATSKKPAVRGTNARITPGVRYLKTGWWCAQSDTNRSPCYLAKNRVIFEKNSEKIIESTKMRLKPGTSRFFE